MNIQGIESVSSKLKEWGNFNSGILFLVKAICTTNEWPYGEIWKADKNNEFMIWSGFWSRNEYYFERFSKFSSFHKFAKGLGLIGRTWKQGNLILLEDISKSKFFMRKEIAKVEGLNSVSCLPLLDNGKVICILSFFLNKMSLDDIECAKMLFSRSESLGKILTGIS